MRKIIFLKKVINQKCQCILIEVKQHKNKKTKEN